jgi:hypothetical protein
LEKKKELEGADLKRLKEKTIKTFESYKEACKREIFSC